MEIILFKRTGNKVTKICQSEVLSEETHSRTVPWCHGASLTQHLVMSTRLCLLIKHGDVIWQFEQEQCRDPYFHWLVQGVSLKNTSPNYKGTELRPSYYLYSMSFLFLWKESKSVKEACPLSQWYKAIFQTAFNHFCKEELASIMLSSPCFRKRINTLLKTHTGMNCWKAEVKFSPTQWTIPCFVFSMVHNNGTSARC